MLNQGDRVFLADTSEGALQRATIFSTVARELQLIPTYFVGVTLKYQQSRIVDLQTDLYASKVVFVYIGVPTLLDNSALPEIAQAMAGGIECRIYASHAVAAEMIAPHASGCPIRHVADDAEFAKILREDMSALCNPKP